MKRIRTAEATHAPAIALLESVMRPYRIHVVLAAAALCPGVNGFAQRPVVVAGGATCTSCSVESRVIAVLGSTDGPGALSVDRPIVSRDARGRYYVMRGIDAASIGVYSPDGQFLRSLGRTGSGPGEYRIVSGVQSLAGDSLLILDGGLRRMTVLSPDYSIVRTVPIAVGGSRPIVLRHRQDQIVVNAPDADRGDPLFVIDALSGKTVRSFASADGTPLAGVVEGTLRSIAADTGREIWMSYATRYTLERWTIDGVRTASVTRSVPWFPEARVPGALARGEPEPLIQDIDVDAHGRLWILISVPDSRWRQAVRIVPNQRFPSVIDPLRHTDALLEVVDPRTNRVLVSQRFDDPATALLPGQFLVQPVTDAAGRPTLRISKLELRDR